MPFLIRVPALMARRLCLLTLLYLAVPLFVFFLGWLRPLLGVPITLVLMAALAMLFAKGWRSFADEEVPTRLERRSVIVAFLWVWVPVALMVLQIGVGGYGVATIDWNNKHNLIFADLIRFPWPVVYHGEGTPSGGLMLVYYIAYYLPAAAVGKLLGWSAANVAWQLWTQLGLLLLCGWLVALAGTRARWMGLLFLAFAGAELIGMQLLKLDIALHLSPASGSLNRGIGDIARWNATETYYVLYRSNIIHLFWTPQHLLGGWLGIGLILNRWNTQRQGKGFWDGGWGGSALLGWSLIVFWSPLSAIGCLPFLVALGVREIRNRRQEKATIQQVASGRGRNLPMGAMVVLSSLLCLGVVGLYLAFRTHPPEGAVPQRGQHLEFLLAPLWREEGWHALWRYGVFVLVEFGLMYLLVWPRRDEPGLAPWRAPLAVGLFVFLLLPCFIFGFYNDLAMRASIPAQATLCLFVAVFLQSKNASRFRRVGVVVLLLCGATTFVFYSRFALHVLRHNQWYTRQPISSFRTIAEEYRNDPRHLITQYTGPTNSPFARFLGK